MFVDMGMRHKVITLRKNGLNQQDFDGDDISIGDSFDHASLFTLFVRPNIHDKKACYYNARS